MLLRSPSTVRVALVIGNSNYHYATRLPNAVVDAEKITNVLASVGFHVTCKLDLTRDETIQSCRDFIDQLSGGDAEDDARPVEIACLYYAGHGVELDGRNLIVPCDYYDTDEAVGAPVPVQDIIDDMGAFAAHSLIFLDACRNAPGMDPGALDDQTVFLLNQGLKKIELPASRMTLIAFAADPGDVASDGEPGEGSPFSNAVASHIPRKNLDLHDAMQGVANDVREATNGEQRPWVYSNMPKTLPLFKGTWLPVLWLSIGGALTGALGGPFMFDLATGLPANVFDPKYAASVIGPLFFAVGLGASVHYFGRLQLRHVLLAFATSFIAFCLIWFVMLARYFSKANDKGMQDGLAALSGAIDIELLLMLLLACGLIGLVSVLSGLPHMDMRSLPRMSVGIVIGATAAAFYYLFQITQGVFVENLGDSYMMRLFGASFFAGIWMAALGANIGWAYMVDVGRPERQ